MIAVRNVYCEPIYKEHSNYHAHSDITELSLKRMLISSFSKFESEESLYGPSVDMLCDMLGSSQKCFLMALNFESMVENPGSDSRSWTAVRPSSMLTTWDIIGLRVGDALVHKRATFSITIASSDEYSDPKSGSTSSSRLPLSCKT